MRIQIVRTGGFTGIALRAEVDSERLTANEHTTLRDLVDNSDFFNLPASATVKGGEVDRYQYEITVEEDDLRHIITRGEGEMNAPLGELVRRVMTLGRGV